MQGQQQQPIIILREGTDRNKGRGAQLNNIAAAKAVADAVRSTLGPKGMDKMLVDSMGDVVITNDGATILKEIDIEHPAAKMVVEVAKTQDNECGDGTTTAVVLAGELLKRAEALIDQNVHPTVIANGYRQAAEESINILKKLGVKVNLKDDKMLRNIAMTAMTGKSVGHNKESLANVAVGAIKAVAEKKNGVYVVDIDNVKVEKKIGGSLADTRLIEGIILDKEKVHARMPTSVKNAKIALIDTALEIKKTEVDAKIQITDPGQLQKFLDEEEKTLKKKADIIKKSGANVVVCQKGIDDLVQHFLAKDGIFAVRRVKKSDMEALAKATGAKLVTNLEDLTPADLGKAGMVEEKKIADSDMTFITGCKDAKSVSILIRGGTEHVIDEAERALHDALKVTAVAMEDGIALSGGGSMEIELSLALNKFGSKVGGREQLAIEAFSKATEIIPWTLAENAGLDAIDVLIQLRSEHEGKKRRNAGIDVITGKVVDMLKENVIEPMRIKTQAINAASEVAIMILRIDDVIAARKGAGGPPGGMPPGGMGGMDY
ncbi:MAG: TCP-1/cpn60 chaperonin family protein [Candidatus Thermoplasmatota archaeon]|nr:thermosome subunit [Euryarchaeota archaeon]MBU4031815.1 TCP-1/cpn60 chaperonin family protein [Candidatus Thermoplasmatota archaeon]MBU4072049.1 TCP-1/cpn60 chaperonin family protein [Candidatus Thermoplasmatota archaeon]MBU4144580.1 TCP-1/cpn60 chaperonin family protein [Candidatus Thermoplasmatota archaeon]MBU4592129.1 TCP-1/cpn60 chaperonin family protein [Candidatus Thermoplasmatota archaeon]